RPVRRQPGVRPPADAAVPGDWVPRPQHRPPGAGPAARRPGRRPPPAGRRLPGPDPGPVPGPAQGAGVRPDPLADARAARADVQKKSVQATERGRPDVARRRAEWRGGVMPGLDADRVVVIDETWAKTNMTRTHGYAPRGERLVDATPHGHWHTTTFVG